METQTFADSGVKLLQTHPLQLFQQQEADVEAQIHWLQHYQDVSLMLCARKEAEGKLRYKRVIAILRGCVGTGMFG